MTRTISGNFLRRAASLFALVLSTLYVLACTPVTGSPGASGENAKLKVVATTTILGDIVKQVGGEAIELEVLLPTGVDPHTFEPTPQDLTVLANSDVVFINGAGLEVFLERLLQSANGGAAGVVSVSEGISLRQFQEPHAGENQNAIGDGADPHVWFDPQNVILWTHKIETTLSELDPDNARDYTENGEIYRQQLRQLDAWIEEQVAKIPVDKRKLVTDHQVFGYFAERYGFEQVGAVIPGFSTAAEPSAGAMAALQDAVRQLGVRAVFVGTTVNPSIAERLAEDTGIQIVPVFTGSLSAPGGQADNYLTYMRYDVSAIVSALKE